MIKHLSISILALAIFLSCSKVVPNSKIDIEFDLVQYESDIRTIEDAMYWAKESIGILGPSTKSVTARTIESWNVATRSSTKAGNSKCDTLFYVFNFEDNAGFSIIAASNSVQPILAVTESGRYVPGESTGNESFDYFMDKMIGTLSFEGIPREEYYWYGYEMVGDSCSRRVPVSWGQSSYYFYDYDGTSHEIEYGAYCPNEYAGCAAVAIGQVMSYHRLPQSFTASCNMGSDYSTGTSITLDWNYINAHPNNYSGNDNCDPYHKSVSALLREIGYRASTDYSNEYESGTNIYNIKNAVESFGIGCSTVANFSSFSAKNAIKTSGPIILYGNDQISSKLHAWVMDAYKDYTYSYCRYERAEDDGSRPIVTRRQIIRESHMFHFNWGYYGRCNGWFAIGEFDPNEALVYDNDTLPSLNQLYSGSGLMMSNIGRNQYILQ